MRGRAGVLLDIAHCFFLVVMLVLLIRFDGWVCVGSNSGAIGHGEIARFMWLWWRGMAE